LLDIPVSLAHHGHFVAYSYHLPADPLPLSSNNSLYRKSAAN
jgi:hypothetical protein